MSSPFTPAALVEALAGCTSKARYWVAFSGGLDSHVLLHALVSLRGRLAGELHAVHVNHGLHGDADGWAEHCRRVCAGLHVPCRVLQVDASPVAGESPEAAARWVRYEAIASLMASGDTALTAHHQDDQAETLLLHLLRGSGPHGLSAMSPCRPFAGGRLARPLLGFPRAALHHYAESQGLRWVEDPSNKEDRYERNFLRNQIMPALKMRWAALPAVLVRAAAHQAEAAKLIDALADIDLATLRGPRQDVLRVDVLGGLSPARQRNALRRWIRALGLPLPTTRHLDRVLGDVVAAGEDRTPLVRWHGAEVRRYRNQVYAMPPLAPHDARAVLDWRLPEPLVLPAGRLEAEAATGAGLRAAVCPTDRVEVRFRQGGERCHLAGRRNSQALKKLLQAHGVPPWLRDRIPLIYIGDQLAAVGDRWVCGPFLAEPDEPGWVLRWHW